MISNTFAPLWGYAAHALSHRDQVKTILSLIKINANR